MALQTVAGLRRQGWFIPYRYADRLPAAGGRDLYPPVAAAFAAAEPAFDQVLDSLDRLAPALLAIGGEPAPAPRWNQDWFPTLDAAVAYAMVRWLRPANVVEVGSGHSTRFLARAVADGGLEGHTRLVAIDPQPRAALALDHVHFLRATLDTVEPSVLAAVGDGDMLFIDSSHILMPGSDVDDLLNRVLPALPAGALVHVDDMFLPDGYPPEWAWRGYNEQNAVAGLIACGAYEVLFASHYVATRLADRLAGSVVARLPSAPGARPAGLWLKKR